MCVFTYLDKSKIILIFQYFYFQAIADDESSSSSSSSIPLTTTSKSIVEVCSSPPPTITLEQAKLDPVINIDSDSDMETDLVEPYSCVVCKYVIYIN